MEKLNELVNKLLDECEAKGIPILLAYGTDKIIVHEFAPDNTPERLLKARTTLISTVKQARRQLEIQA